MLWNFVLTVGSSAIVWTLEIHAETTTSAANMSYYNYIVFLFDWWRISHAKIIRCMNTSKDKIDRNKNVVSVHIRCSNCSACPYCIHTILIVLRHPYKSLLTTTICTTQRLVHIIYILWITIFMYFILLHAYRNHILHTYIHIL